MNTWKFSFFWNDGPNTCGQFYQHFMSISLRQKNEPFTTLAQKSCLVDFRTKKVLKKCWWNWPLQKFYQLFIELLSQKKTQAKNLEKMNLTNTFVQKNSCSIIMLVKFRPNPSWVRLFHCSISSSASLNEIEKKLLFKFVHTSPKGGVRRG